MAKVRYTALNAIVEYSDDGVAYTEIENVREFKIQGRERSEVDLTALKDTSSVTSVGRFQPSSFEFQTVYDPTATDEAYLDSILTSGAEKDFRITITDGTTTAAGDFKGRVRMLDPQPDDGDTGLFRNVILSVTTDIAWT